MTHNDDEPFQYTVCDKTFKNIMKEEKNNQRLLRRIKIVHDDVEKNQDRVWWRGEDARVYLLQKPEIFCTENERFEYAVHYIDLEVHHCFQVKIINDVLTLELFDNN